MNKKFDDMTFGILIAILVLIGLILLDIRSTLKESFDAQQYITGQLELIHNTLIDLEK